MQYIKTEFLSNLSISRVAEKKKLRLSYVQPKTLHWIYRRYWTRNVVNQIKNLQSQTFKTPAHNRYKLRKASKH